MLFNSMKFASITLLTVALTMPLLGKAEALSTEPVQVIAPPTEKSARDNATYFIDLLHLALTKSIPTYGPFQLSQSPSILTQGRFLAELENDGAINVMWTMTNAHRELALIPIKIPLLKDLNSYRIFLINERDQKMLSQIKTQEQLKKLRGGLGAHWPDVQVMRDNGYRLTTTTHYELLFKMLKSNRFDYFPRGLYEIWHEQAMHADEGLVIENSLMLHYQAPMYFFVSRSNPDLARRIAFGLELAMQDGSFDRLFFSVPGFKRGFHELNNNDRKVFELSTPAPSTTLDY